VIGRPIAVLVIGLAGAFQSSLLAQENDGQGQGGIIYLHETFEKNDNDSAPQVPQLQRVDMVTTIRGDGVAGLGKVARFDDSDTSKGGAMEYNLGNSALGSMFIEFDACNNDNARLDRIGKRGFAA